LVAEFVDRTNGVPGFAMVASGGSHAARCTELHRSQGTEGSNPSSSSGESIAEPDFLDQDGTEHPQLVEIGREVSI
jgi:hypothetical protein